MASTPKVVIVELGSQYTQVIARTVCELGVDSMVLDPLEAGKWIQEHPVRAIILSGGYGSVYEKGAPQPPPNVLSLRYQDRPVHVLGICYGMQWIAHALGGKVKAGRREYGPAEVRITSPDAKIFHDWPSPQKVWASHGDSVLDVPQEFKVIAKAPSGGIAAMMNNAQTIFGVQFHPEVKHTPNGKTILKNFLDLAGCEKDWKPGSLIESFRQEIEEQVGRGRAIIGASGGVDSMATIALAAPVLKDRLFPITIDGNQLREGELEEIKRNVEMLDVRLNVLNEHPRFSTLFADTIDAEEKRHRFKREYANLFVRAARDPAIRATHFLQGTIAPDLIESGKTGGARIKSHHNTDLALEGVVEVNPLRKLFKYQVRALAEELGLPRSVWNRQPFPGPGLIVRVVGIHTVPDSIAVARWADARTREILEKNGVYEDISQLVVAYGAPTTVCVKGDSRAYVPSAFVRGVKTFDFMTAEGMEFPVDVRREIKSLLSSHPKIGRVFFDESDKPPATTEFE